MASISNTYNNYMGAYTSLYSNSNKTSNTQDSLSPLQDNTEQTNLSDSEILDKISNQTHFYQESWRKEHNKDNDILQKPQALRLSVSFYEQDKGFISKIDTKLQEKSTKNITLQEVEEAQEFLNKQMDNVMLELYKKNPELMESTMKRDYDFYANDGLKDNYKPSEEIANLQFDRKISNLLLEYGIRTEAQELDKRFENFLVEIKRDVQNGDADEITSSDLAMAIGLYRQEKMQMSGYSFFSQVTDMLSPAQQEKITDAISSVLSFYSRSNSIDINGTKVSWETQVEGDNSVYGLNSNVSFYIGCIDVKIEYNTSNDDFLLPLNAKNYNFDTTQSIFDILNQKEKLEKENQDLKSKQAIEAYSYGNGYSSTLTSKTSKEIDSFINQMIKEAKA
ncbi:hypothetical protein BA184_04025 [Helicobacter pullorum]|uniref:hypothetical protein n=2 Tax=Helicobacter pullorum TaxID=35818 RepID=UPI000816A292|nr:hypothetical protein [Helicobacter pullorum]OCR06680.1 hypothetical protein BA185_06645 [Helicobacter pullorum]OCR10656.1 hypothetical protein BA184_04025 [Helicobacter pullorum]OCR13509.1 hypothetical protein BA730_00365 [Helicobacter pullorum]